MENFPSMLLMGKFPVLLMYIVPSFLSTLATYVKIWLYFSLSTGVLISLFVSIIFDFPFILFCVVLIPFSRFLIWPSSVAGELYRIYFYTAVSIRPDQVATWLFRMALMSVRLGRQKRHWWRYQMRSPLEVIWYALPSYCLLDVIVWIDRFSGGVPVLSGRTHNLVDGSRVPCHTSLLMK